MIPRNAGRGIIGVKDFGFVKMGLGSSIRGGGMRCLETRISMDYYCYLSYGEGE